MHETATALLSSLLSIPRADDRLIERERLAQRLDEGARFRVIHVSAPAGFGKTSLVAGWVHRRLAAGENVAWVTLNERHDDASALLRYVVAALRTSVGAIGEATLTLLNSNVPMSPDSLVTTLVNELGGLAEDVYLVLDDWHHVVSTPAVEALGALLQHGPPRLHFILTSRAAPTAPLGRMRQLGEVYELAATDLEFTAAEVARFAARERLDLDEAALTTLARKTGGWAAGLRLAAISMRDELARERFIESLSGEHAAVAQFLREDVLARQPAELQTFLVQSGLLDELTAPMCDFVLERTDSGRLLDLAQQRGLFVFALDPAGERYRYHRMFADFLRQRLLRDDPEAAARIHRRASEWCARHGGPVETVDYALRAGDVDAAGRHLEARSESIFSSGQLDVLQSLAARLPETVQDRCPRLQLDLIWIHTLRWEIDDAVRRLRRVQRYVEGLAKAETVPPELQEKVLHRELMVALLRDDLPQAEALWARWPGVSSGTNDYFDGSAETADLLPRRERFECEFVLAQAARIRRKYTNAGTEFGTVWFDCIIGPAYFANGQCELARSVLGGAIETAVRISGADSPLVAMPSLLLADVLYEIDDTDAAAALLDGWLAHADRIGFVDQLIAGFVCAARLARLRGEMRTADRLLDQGEDIASTYGFARLTVQLVGERVRQLLADDAVAQAVRRVNACALVPVNALAPPGRLASTSDLAAMMMHGRIARAKRDTAFAVRVIKSWINHVERRGCLRDAVRLRALLASVHADDGNYREAWRVLRPAVAHVARTGLLRPLLDEGRAVIDVLAHARGDDSLDGDPHLPLVSQLCELAAGDTDAIDFSARPRPPAAGYEESLTPRQREVLVCVAEGCSNKEIAARIGLTEATVKWHLQQVYERLGAHRRVAAVRRARELGIID